MKVHMCKNIKVVSWNVNGLRACFGHGGLEVLDSLNPDIICLQEIKLSKDSLSVLEKNFFKQYHLFYSLSERKGRNGVLIASKLPVIDDCYSIGMKEFDLQGRFVMIKLTNGLQVINLYMPHGKRDKSELEYKLKVFAFFSAYLKKNASSAIICTDFNIAHTELDLARPKNNLNNIMFTENERQAVDQLIQSGYCDITRSFYKGTGHFTWWPYAYDAWNKNIGWRIDYFFVNEAIKKYIKSVEILRNIRCSDHCPIILNMTDPSNIIANGVPLL